MNNNALIKKEGIVMNSQLNFGDPTPFFSEFNNFLILENTEWDAKFHYYYRITGDDYIQIARGFEDKEHTICAQFKKTNTLIDILSFKEIKILTHYLPFFILNLN